jgi:lipopolysaccharide heptosyltransferase I
MNNPRRILIIKPSALGDIVHALPILHLVRRRWPEAHIAWLVNPAFAGLLDGNPDLNEVIRFDRREHGSAFLWSLRRRRFDLTVDLQGLLRSGLLSWISGAKDRVGFANAREGAAWCYSQRVVVSDVEQHALDRYLILSDAIGCGKEPVEFILPRAALNANLLPAADSPYAVLLPATNWATKRWPIEYFAALCEPLTKRFGLQTVVAGGTDAVEMAAKTSLPQLVTLLEGASVVIANDSGPMHIAAALDRPLVTMFGPTNPVRTGPFRRMETVVRLEIVCSPCYSRSCSHQSCLRWLTPEMVMAEVRAALEGVALRADR